MMKGTTLMTTSPTLLPVHACDHVLHISAVETPLITEFVAAPSHLERAAALSGTSGALMLPNGKSVTTREMSEYSIGRRRSVASTPPVAPS
jgi:hypothetical protein